MSTQSASTSIGRGSMLFSLHEQNADTIQAYNKYFSYALIFKVNKRDYYKYKAGYACLIFISSPKSDRCNDCHTFLPASATPKAIPACWAYRDTLSLQTDRSTMTVHNTFLSGQCAIQEVTGINLNARFVGIDIKHNTR